MKLIVLAAVALAVSGCGLARQKQVQADVEAAKTVCRSTTFPNRVENAKCINAAEQKLAAVYDKPDLLQLRLAARLAIAEKQDRKEMSDAEGELEFAKINAQIGGQEASRNANAEMAAAATAAAMPRSTTCTRIGNSVTCF